MIDEEIARDEATKSSKPQIDIKRLLSIRLVSKDLELDELPFGLVLSNERSNV